MFGGIFFDAIEEGHRQAGGFEQADNALGVAGGLETTIGDQEDVAGGQVPGEFTNAFNLVNLGSPTATLSSSQFGQVRSANSMRQVQLGLRLTF